MNHRELKEELKIIGEKAVEKLDYELVDVSFNHKKNPMSIEFIVFHVDGVKLDDCVLISRDIDQVLEERDLIQGSFQLEVSSPGLDRLIETKDDYRRNLGKLLEAHLYTKLNGKKEFIGTLVDYDEEYIYLLQDEDDRIIIPQKSISMLRQVILF